MPSQKQIKSHNFPDFPIFPRFFPIFPILDFSGFSGKKNRGNRIICEKPGRYVITPYYIDTLAKTEWKNLVCN